MDSPPAVERRSAGALDSAVARVAGILGDRFAAESRLGEGSCGVVYRAIDRETGARVAVKTLHAVTAEHIAILKNEFRAVQGLHHPNLVQIGELVEGGGQWLLSMEYVDGVDFLGYVKDPKRGFHEGRLRAALRQLASALAALHGARTVHRDVKPSNVLVSTGGRLVVLDFGIARRQEERPGSRDEGITGTVHFAAPEQAAGEVVGPPADWYAMGVMLFAALTGALPFEGSARDVVRRKLVEEAPSPRTFAAELPEDLTRLCEQLLRLDPAERPSASEILGRLGVGSVPPASLAEARTVPLLGRDAELAWLRDAFEASREGAAVAATLCGESGVGKSIVLRTFADRLGSEHPELLTLYSRCYERESVPFKAFDGAAERLVGVLDALDHDAALPWLSEHAGLLPRIFPELGAVPWLSELASSVLVEDPQEARRCGFDALRALLRGVAASRPVLLAIDDLQWADADSIALLRALLEPPGAPTLLVVCTLRVGTETGSRGKDELGRLPGDTRTLHLEKLSSLEAQRFVSDLLEHEQMTALAADELDAVVREARGHPMFLTELVLHRKHDDAPASHHKLDDALRARVRRLSSPAQRLLEIVCLAGIPILERVAADAASVEAAELMGILPQLQAERLVKTWASGRATTVEPYHDRVRESVVAALTGEKRRAKHAMLALALERGGTPVDPEVLAQQWIESGDELRAKDYVLRAAEKAAGALAFERAAGFYSQSIALSQSPEERRSLRSKLAEALSNGGRWAEAGELRLALADEAAPVDALQLKTLAAEQFLCSGHFERGATVLESVLRAVKVYVPKGPWMTLLALLVSRAFLALRGLRYTLREGVLPAELAVRIDPLVSAGSGFSMTDHARGSYLNTRALIRALGAGDPERLVRTVGIEVGFSSGEGLKSQKRTQALLAKLRSIAAAVDTPFARAMVAGTTGWYHYFLQDWPNAKRELLTAERMFGEQCVGQFWTRATTRTLAFRAMAQLGEREELAALVARALREMEQVGDLYGLTNLRSGPLAWLALADDEADRCEEELRRAAKNLPEHRFIVQTYFHLIAAAQLDLYERQFGRAHDRMEQAWGPLRWSLLLRVSAIRIQALELRGRAALALAGQLAGEEREKPLRLVESVAARLAREGCGYSDGYSALLRAGAHALRSQREPATRCAQKAERAFGGASMTLHAAACLWSQGALGSEDDGAAQQAQARAVMLEAGIRAPERFAAMLAPGLLDRAGGR